MSEIKVAFLMPTVDSRGPLNQIEILAEALATLGVGSILVTMRESRGGAVSTLPTRCLKMRYVWDLRVLFRLHRVLREERVVILHTRLNSANFWGSLHRYLYRSPVHVMNVTNSLTASFRYTHGVFLGVLHRFAFQRVINGADAIVTNAPFLKSEIEISLRPRMNVSVIQNAVRPGEITVGSRHAPQIIGIVSRIEYYKHVDDLILAFPKIAEGLPDVALHVAGAGDYLDVCKSIVKKFDPEVRRRVSFLGHCDDIQALLPRFSVLVHTSESEGQPNAVLEAMNAGVPVVCSNYPGVDALIQHGVTGLIYGAAGHEDLAETVRRVLADVGLRERLAEKARHHVQTYHAPERAAAAFMELYHELLAHRKPQNAAR